jgi:hypothetical protein
MPIINSVYKGKNLFASEFFCPNCFVIKPYEIKPLSKELKFYPIAFLESNESGHVVECKVCKNAFDPEILQRNIQRLLKLAGAAKYQLDLGISPRYLKLQLISDGLQESVADNLINLAQH